MAIRATKKRIVLWECMTLVGEIETDEYILEYPSLMPLHEVMETLRKRGYPSDITQWRHVV